MSDYLYKPTAMDKIVPIMCGIILLAFLATVPSMINDKNKREAKAWQDSGCQMYDNLKPANVPVKCSNQFTDHYKAQAGRIQPPEVTK